MDFKTAFLHVFLDKELYMKQPEQYAISGKEHLICKLKRSLYGLIKGPQTMVKKLNAFMLKHGFKWSLANHYLYSKKDKDGNPIILVLYVDDMLLTRKKKSILNTLKQ